MSVEFRITSAFQDLTEIAYERNTSEEWRRVFGVKPSIGRIVKLRGRLPAALDIPDILYDLSDFTGVTVHQNELLRNLSKLTELESTYYPLAENLAASTALSCGLYERIPDFIDVAKDLTARVVWIRWRPEKGEDFIDLHRKIVHELRKGLVFAWNRNFYHQPFSYLEPKRLTRSLPYQEVDNSSPQVRPIFRLRTATGHLSLPSIIAGVENARHLEGIATLTIMGYYPDGRGLTGVAKKIGVKTETLSAAIDSASSVLSLTQDGVRPQRSIRQIVEELIEQPVMRYPSGKNVERTNPRLKLFELREIPLHLSEREKEIVHLAIQHQKGALTYSSEDIANLVGLSKVVICRIIRKVANSEALSGRAWTRTRDLSDVNRTL